MPLDASIYNIQKPLQVRSPLETFGRMQQMQNAQQVNQINAERLKQEQQQTAAAERKVQNADIWQKAYQESGGDLDKAEQLGIQYGADPDSIAAFQQHKQTVVKGRLEIKGKEDEQARAKRTERDSRMQGIIQQATAMARENPTLYAQRFPEIYNAAVTIDPETAKHLKPDTPPSLEDLGMFGLHYATQAWADQQADNARKEEDQKFKREDQGFQRTEAAEKQRQNDAAQLAMIQEQQGPEALGMAIAQLPPDRRRPFSQLRLNMKPEEIRRLGMDAQQVAQADQARANAERQAMPNTETELAQAAVDPTKTPEQRAAAEAALKRLDKSKRESRPINNFDLTSLGLPAGMASLKGEELLAALPGGLAAEIRGMAEGRLTAPPASSRAAGAQQKRSLLMAYDPNFSEQRAQVRKAFTTGKAGDNIGSLNTATVHLDAFMEAAQALNNGSFKPGNAAYNALRDMFGSSAPADFEMLKNVAAGEAANALKGNATDVEIAAIKKGIENSGSPGALRSSLTKLMNTYHEKLNTYDERFHKENPDDTKWSPVLPQARGVFEKRGVIKGAADQSQEQGGLKKGQVVNGFRYKGGDPNTQSSWESAKQ
jgi:hypothetical protein